MRLKPASGRESETKPSAAISSAKPKWSLTKRADACGSATLREMADAVMFIPYTVQSFMRTGEGDPARTLALLWRRAERGTRGPRPKLSVDAVVDAAIALADEAGLQAVSMRTLAGRLGVSAMTLYTYVPGKAELLDLMLDALW